VTKATEHLNLLISVRKPL